MRYAPLTLENRKEWAELLAVSFERTPGEMNGLLGWLNKGWPVIAWGAWDGDKLAAQYSCRLVNLHVPGSPNPVLAGMSINMAVHPDYRGQGLTKHVARPVYQVVVERGGIAGVGFSNAEGVQVDLKSKSYGYQVVGKMSSTLVWLFGKKSPDMLTLSDYWTDMPFNCLGNSCDNIHFAQTPESLAHRFARHPFRKYRFGFWREGNALNGVVIYRPIQLGLLKGAALLAAYSPDLPELLRRWSSAIQDDGWRFVHVMTSPQSDVHQHIHQLGFAADSPYIRSPYFLTAKSFGDQTPPEILDFASWDCTGGDVL